MARRRRHHRLCRRRSSPQLLRAARVGTSYQPARLPAYSILPLPSSLDADFGAEVKAAEAVLADVLEGQCCRLGVEERHRTSWECERRYGEVPVQQPGRGHPLSALQAFGSLTLDTPDAADVIYKVHHLTPRGGLGQVAHENDAVLLQTAPLLRVERLHLELMPADAQGRHKDFPFMAGEVGEDVPIATGCAFHILGRRERDDVETVRPAVFPEQPLDRLALTVRSPGDLGAALLQPAHDLRRGRGVREVGDQDLPLHVLKLHSEILAAPFLLAWLPLEPLSLLGAPRGIRPPRGHLGTHVAASRDGLHVLGLQHHEAVPVQTPDGLLEVRLGRSGHHLPDLVRAGLVAHAQAPLGVQQLQDPAAEVSDPGAEVRAAEAHVHLAVVGHAGDEGAQGVSHLGVRPRHFPPKRQLGLRGQALHLRLHAV
eukprot:scaffold1462_cov260-Pinguiococcus_pyrenoidosus.AAC.15